MAAYDHKKIEKKWQQRWREAGLYDTSSYTGENKEYVLVEWPYPSGDLHIGHWYAFAIPDIYVRAHRMQGKEVIFPMGFDAFGLPAENAAIKRALSPREWTERNVANMKVQFDSMGNAFSWDRMTSSTDPDYYRWTQWMFTKFFEKDIAYRGTGIVNWCPGCRTVLANEQVINGECERCGSTVEKKEMAEWKMRITKYADRLIDDLDALDWPDHIKELQRNWIGRSNGAEIDFSVAESEEKIRVFTTRPDTLFGATYMVLAPEHPLVDKLSGRITNHSEVKAYVERASAQTEIERTAEGKEKTGIELSGVKAINPATKEEIPIFVADYVLGHYGTGAIMAVPAHDERDFEFAKKFDLEIRRVIEIGESFFLKDIEIFEQRKLATWDKEKGETFADGEQNNTERLRTLILNGEAIYFGSGYLINSGKFNDLYSEEAKQKITESVGGRMTSTFKLRDWSVGRQRYWGVPIPIVYDPEGTPHAIPEEHLPWTLPDDVDMTPTGEPPLAKSRDLVERTERIFGKGWRPEVETLDTFVDSSWYFLRYIDNHNETSFSSLSAQQQWMPIDIYFGGSEHTTLHLLYSRFWQKVLFDLKLAGHNEPYKRRINRGLVLGPDGNKMSKSKGNVIDPDEQVARLGADTVKMYLAFMGPYGHVANYPWDMGGIAGIRRFLERVWDLADNFSDNADETVEQSLHQTILKVTKDIEAYKFNTAISALMVFTNTAGSNGITKEQYEIFLHLLAPFAPHIADELWERLGHTQSIHTEKWPAYDEEKARESTATIVVQVNGKVRDKFSGPADMDEEQMRERALDSDGAKKWMAGNTPKKVIIVPGKLVNIVV